MRYLFLGLYTVLLALLVMMGCSSDRPICGDTLCVTGEVFLKSELPAGAEYDSVNVDESGLLAFLRNPDTIATPALEISPPIAETIKFADIVADVEAGGNSFMCKIISITATVDREASTFPNKNAITLTTHNTTVDFFVTHGYATEAHMATYRKNHSYDFNLFVIAIRAPDTDDKYAVWTVLLETTEAIPVSSKALSDNAASGSTQYLNKIVSFEGIIERDSDFYGDENDAVSIITNNKAVIFYIANWNEPPKRMSEYVEGQAYEFTVFIRQIDFKNSLYFVQSNLVVE